jgi:hypothetical protein
VDGVLEKFEVAKLHGLLFICLSPLRALFALLRATHVTTRGKQLAIKHTEASLCRSNTPYASDLLQQQA